MKIGTQVKPNISKKAGHQGVITSFGKNPALPYGVTFPDENIEWDFAKHELEVTE